MAEIRSRPTKTTQYNEEEEVRTFNLKVFNGNIQAAVRGIRGQRQSPVLFPGNTEKNTGRPVMEILIEKHPTMRIPDLTDPECSSFKEYNK